MEVENNEYDWRYKRDAPYFGIVFDMCQHFTFQYPVSGTKCVR